MTGETRGFCALGAAATELDVTRAPSLDRETLDALRVLVRDHVTLEDVARWALSSHPPRVFTDAIAIDAPDLATARRGLGFDVVVQDEFTHDVVVPHDVQRSVYLVYDTT